MGKTNLCCSKSGLWLHCEVVGDVLFLEQGEGYMTGLAL